MYGVNWCNLVESEIVLQKGEKKIDTISSLQEAGLIGSGTCGRHVRRLRKKCVAMRLGSYQCRASTGASNLW